MPTIPNLIVDTSLVFNSLIFSFLGVMVFYYTFKYAEQTYAESSSKPFFRSLILFKKKLSKSETLILERNFSFYNKLNNNQQKQFQHRMAKFKSLKNFVGREGLVVTDEMKILISATAIMMTFGFRSYSLDIINTILIYPKAFYSKQNDSYHKGEVNPRMKVMALSWTDFLHGYDIKNDNLNLGIHEFAHAIHLSGFKNKDVSAQIFNDGFVTLKKYLKLNEAKRQKLIQTRYFREYAYTNEYEFIAVILECFFETPTEFSTNFPQIYTLVKRMLNFNFAKY